ncbi:MAG: hypothetical protein N2Z23_03380 [Pyrinomonadaceae bacterium]|nr:hypothetical protein [Pyrinomonadaceae bacterium]MCX7639469.1 hypothetical protein [Pyrinomonadaceae bacterium]MDW8304480.1 hypothetical protein [Acidobacteriota bacterium]
MNRDEVKLIIRQLLDSLQAEAKTDYIIESIKLINQRLDRIEQIIDSNYSENTQQKIHPSQEKFKSLKPLAYQELHEKICPFEPDLKKCDECGMCSCRGF